MLIPQPQYQYLLSVVDCQIPYSFYTINENNNTFIFNGQLHTITSANYDIIQLCQEVTDSIPNLTITYSEYTNKCTMYTDNGTNFTIRNSGSHEPFLKFLGFKLDSYENSNEYVSDSVVNVSGPACIYVSSNLGTSNFNSQLQTSSNILCKIPINTLSNGIIFYENYFQYRSLIYQNNISEIMITLLDDFYFPINLNGVDFTITLQFDVILTPSV